MLKNNYRIAVITLSDRGYQKERADTSGPAIIKIAEESGFQTVYYEILPDEKELLADRLRRLADEKLCDLIITTGGTGFGKRDVTPEATKEVIEREAPGIAEAIRYYSLSITKRAMLGRGIAGIRNNALIVNLPGSEKAVKESLTYIIDTLEHGLNILLGNERECAGSDENK